MEQSPRTLAETLTAAAEQLGAVGCDTPRLDAELLLGEVLQQSRSQLYLNLQQPLAPPQRAQFEALLTRRLDREPVAYILGRRSFYGLEFEVTPDVLIPRPETELLVETALKNPKKSQPSLTIADIGTGSGCIAVTLAKLLPQAQVWAVDVSPAALEVAQRNAHRHGVESQIRFLHGNLLTPLPQPVDLLVSNPPYVTAADLATNVSREVAIYEPRLALDGGGDAGLSIIEALLSQAKAYLKPESWLLCEIGASQGEAVLRLARQQFPASMAEVKQDLSRQNRLLVMRHF